MRVAQEHSVLARSLTTRASLPPRLAKQSASSLSLDKTASHIPLISSANGIEFPHITGHRAFMARLMQRVEKAKKGAGNVKERTKR
jgi:hypothetical protein